jgi:cytochrome P450
MNTSTALRDLNHVRSNTQKSQWYSVFSYFFKVPMSMTTMDRKVHAFKRRVDAEALTSTAIQELEPHLLRNIRQFCSKMLDSSSKSGDWSKSRNMTSWIAYLMADLMGEITFHKSWDMVESEKNRNVLKILNTGVAGLHLVCYNLQLGLLD